MKTGGGKGEHKRCVWVHRLVYPTRTILFARKQSTEENAPSFDFPYSRFIMGVVLCVFRPRRWRKSTRYNQTDSPIIIHAVARDFILDNVCTMQPRGCELKYWPEEKFRTRP